MLQRGNHNEMMQGTAYFLINLPTDLSPESCFPCAPRAISSCQQAKK
jgi:hypothetical protein